MWEVYNASTPWKMDRSGQYTKNPAFPATWCGAPPPALVGLIDRCLSWEASSRPTADEVVSEVNAIMEALVYKGQGLPVATDLSQPQELISG